MISGKKKTTTMHLAMGEGLSRVGGGVEEEDREFVFWYESIDT